MKNAKLWKRILREGVDGPAGEVINAIITAPIITDGLSPDHYDGPMNWMRHIMHGGNVRNQPLNAGRHCDFDYFSFVHK